MLRLCTVLGWHVDLERGQSYVLGRGADCDVLVEDRISSRHHARISVASAADVATIVDLDSRNGTYVNDRPIAGSTPLRAGDRIRIGATVYLMAQDDAVVDDVPLMAAETTAMDRLALGEKVSSELMRVFRKDGDSSPELAGQIGVLSVVELLQSLSQSNRSGTLHFALEAGEATIEMRDGQIVSASFEELSGVPALQMLAKRGTGLFWLVDSGTECPRTIHEPTTRLLLDLCWDNQGS
ncbi:MAG: FHA domain-containing protein [Planctomycetota bacterium]|jgi:hypothetical protein